MEWGTVAGMVTALATIITGIVSLKVLKTSKETHVIVNQQRTNMEQYTKALQAALKAAGVDVPDDQSKLD